MSMKSLAATTVIRATPELVWSILTDAAGYAGWNPEVTAIEGEITTGAEITIHRRTEPRASTVRVSIHEPPGRLAFTGSGGTPDAVLEVVRTYQLIPNGNGEVELAQPLVFSGIMSGLLTRSVPDQTPVLVELGEVLKRHAEASLGLQGEPGS